MTDTNDTTNNNQLAVREYSPTLTALEDNFLNPQRFDQLWRVARAFAATDLVPAHFKKPENAFVALQMAFRSGIDPMVALQNLYIVQGRPGMSAALSIALANSSGKLKGPIRYQETGSGPQYVVTAKAITHDGHEITAQASMAMAEAEGWTRNNKYKTMPQVMLRYRAATLLIRQHMPEVLLGLHTAEELEDVAASKSAPRIQEKPVVVDEIPFAPPAETRVDAALPVPQNIDSSFVQNSPAPAKTRGNRGKKEEPAVTTSPSPPTNGEDPYSLLKNLFERPETTDAVKEKLTALSRRALKPGDRMYIVSAWSKGNKGDLSELDDLIKTRPEES